MDYLWAWGRSSWDFDCSGAASAWCGWLAVKGIVPAAWMGGANMISWQMQSNGLENPKMFLRICLFLAGICGIVANSNQ